MPGSYAGMMKEFRKFAARWNVMDMAVGTAFGEIVSILCRRYFDAT